MPHRPITLVLLTAVYAASLASADPVDLGIGLALAVGLTARYGAFVFAKPDVTWRGLPKRAEAVVPLAGAICRSVITGTWQVTRAVLRKEPPAHAGFVTVVLDEATPGGVTACALLITLSPGSLAVDVDPNRRAIRLHVLDAADPGAVQRDVQHFYRRYQRRVIP